VADQSDDIKPWTIKGVGPEARNAATAAAGREKQTIGEWITRAIRTQIQSDRQQDRAPVVVGPVVNHETDLATLERLVALTASLAAAGAPPPKAVSRQTYSLIRDSLAAIKGGGPTAGAVSRTKGQASMTNENKSPTQTESSPADLPDGPTTFPRPGHPERLLREGEKLGDRDGMTEQLEELADRTD
jgi:hypothetical protein